MIQKIKPKFPLEYIKSGAYLYICSAEVSWGTADWERDEYWIFENECEEPVFKHKPVPPLEGAYHACILEPPNDNGWTIVSIQWPPTRGFIGEYLVHVGMLKTREMI